MNSTVQRLLAPYKGILAADESTKTIEKRLMAYGLQSTEEIKQAYRKMLFTTPDIEKYISGIILYKDSLDFIPLLNQKGITAGIKVDEGLESFNGTEEEVTKGLEGLSARLDKYINLGVRFTKWRAVIKISNIYPSDTFLEENLGRMSKYAKMVQEKEITPIVEPEVLLDGNHTTARCEETMTKTLKKLFELLIKENVDLDNLLLKSSMVLPGKDSGVEALPLEVANATLRTFRNSVPNKLRGIVFLSGGQTSDQAINNLNEIVKLNIGNKFGPWDISFSYSRALQNDALAIWIGKIENVTNAQEVFGKRLQMVSKARMGEL
ncbi:MAG: Fructose-bisphosphate aldolase [Candidatus Woesebacteria bacterium GW2011_GWA1_33_30]|uniref:fructose-bisphosphate aldolase n=1 Tax=Candidatus Woesebacteria bacterium GW2011_GWA2_33_28 TaxID=1618561 RepID=A0A0G0A7L1_9BACT|nr:MAG: Fructose-bisphosphate aldolase [Candidatus Woesebacteria bacterium GW2011_GWA2_33_28]KKP48172.1 MAG: Fructose-bisphosphate aldolase [Candidatus Woesebacteria bacterium GW2011_GWA1_33_30]KKP49414.1 MAG: Fructose-bisphosphate aldolase class-I [Microgenomates group bacterium GW2011_GWC1_33_32]KKP52140.1 MAG: Fructose-bisphosphate aldolase [Candidatus Woesebacteria bacterium GW2011_GWB1_33_38]